MRTVEEKKQWDLQAYGCSAGAIDKALEDYRDPLMLAASMLSDAQEVISGEFGQPDTETARQFINRAKYIMFKMMKDAQDA
jgi:predicted urease superfamily metal-dependent hydrolase